MSELHYTIAGEAMYWTPAQLLSYEQKTQYASHEASKDFKFEGIINFMGEIASVYNDDYGQQMYFYLDGTSGADPKGYSCGSFNSNWEAVVASAIGNLRGRQFSPEELTDITHPSSSEE